jgi:hypothetical protein
MFQHLSIENPEVILIHSQFCGKLVFAENSMQTSCKHTPYVAFENIMRFAHKRVDVRLGAYDELEDLKGG